MSTDFRGCLRLQKRQQTCQNRHDQQRATEILRRALDRLPIFAVRSRVSSALSSVCVGAAMFGILRRLGEDSQQLEMLVNSCW